MEILKRFSRVLDKKAQERAYRIAGGIAEWIENYY